MDIVKASQTDMLSAIGQRSAVILGSVFFFRKIYAFVFCLLHDLPHLLLSYDSIVWGEGQKLFPYFAVLVINQKLVSYIFKGQDQRKGKLGEEKCIKKQFVRLWSVT